MTIGIRNPQDKHRAADQRECEQCPDAGQVSQDVKRQKAGRCRYHQSGEHRRLVRSSEFGVNRSKETMG